MTGSPKELLIESKHYKHFQIQNNMCIYDKKLFSKNIKYL